jgi:hypothetical protein
MESLRDGGWVQHVEGHCPDDDAIDDTVSVIEEVFRRIDVYSNKREMKYYVGELQMQFGEFDPKESFLFATAGDADQLMEEIAKDWYDRDEHDSVGLREGMYWNYEMAYGAGRHYEVTKATYDELKDKRVFTEMWEDSNG